MVDRFEAEVVEVAAESAEAVEEAALANEVRMAAWNASLVAS